MARIASACVHTDISKDSLGVYLNLSWFQSHRQASKRIKLLEKLKKSTNNVLD